jgi:tetratricopeptide (TPR) repeat protein
LNEGFFAMGAPEKSGEVQSGRALIGDRAGESQHAQLKSTIPSYSGSLLKKPNPGALRLLAAEKVVLCLRMDTDKATKSIEGPVPPAEIAPLVPVLLDAALHAQRNGTLEEMVRKHPRAARWMMRAHWTLVCGTAAGDLPTKPLPQVADLLLCWLVTQLRPDAVTSFDGVSDDAWLNSPGWRPMLAMASHLGLLFIPDFPRRYRRRSGEPPLDNLCGLWEVDSSTVYRQLEKARQTMIAMLVSSGREAAARIGLRQWVEHSLRPPLERGLVSTDQEAGHRRHQQRAQWAVNAKDPVSALWHLTVAHDVSGFIEVVHKFAPQLAAEIETDALVERVDGHASTKRVKFDLWMARAALARTRNQADRELLFYERARALAQTADDPLLLGIVHSALGKYYEPRDADRAFACYQDSAEFLRDLGPEEGDPQALEHFVTTFARLAWLYLLRNDERSRAVLDRAESLRQRFRVPDAVLGMLEQVWGQYWRRAGDISRSLEHRYRALNIFERLGDQRSVLAACVNIGFDLASKGDHIRVVEISKRVLDAETRGEVDGAVVASVHLNLGASHFWRREFDPAIREYRQALDQSLDCQLKLHAFRARYNLAETHYTRFKESADPWDEREGDAHIQTALAQAGSEVSPAAIESANQLKAELLKRVTVPETNRLLPNESAVHFDEMTEIHRQRDILAVPADPESHAQAHLIIARAYATIAAKEREAALALIQRAGLQDRFSADFTELQQTFERGLTREQQIANTWKQQASDLLDDTRRASVIAHLQRDGAINKSRYAELGAVSPATASKHLAMLTERALLVQQGKGPSTRYVLPA